MFIIEESQGRKFLSLNTHFRTKISYSHHNCLYAGYGIMFLPSPALHMPACLMLVLLLTPLEHIFSRTGLKITALGSGWTWAAVLHVCFPTASEPSQQRSETVASLLKFKKPWHVTYTPELSMKKGCLELLFCRELSITRILNHSPVCSCLLQIFTAWSQKY